VDEDFILNEHLTFSSKILVAFYKYDIVGFQLLALIIVLMIFFSKSHRFQLSLYEAIENVMPNENRYAVLV
jgi:hypothetical protein